LAASEYIKDFKGKLMVTVGDNPYITAPEIKNLIRHHNQTKANAHLFQRFFPLPHLHTAGS